MWWMPSSAMALPPGPILPGRDACVCNNIGPTRSRGACWYQAPMALLPSPRRAGTLPMATPPHPAARSEPPAEAVPLDDRELRAWRGMLRVHATLTKALDAELEA